MIFRNTDISKCRNIEISIYQQGMQKLFIQNRKGQKVAVLVENQKRPRGLAFVMHGLGGLKEGPMEQAVAEVFGAANYTVVRFDTTNTFGESDGRYEDATTTNYCEDLEDVIAWAKTQGWYQEPFVLAGQSLGGLCVALYAEEFPDKVKALAPIATVVSGHLSGEVRGKKAMRDWQESGWEIRESSSVPGRMKKLPWSHMEDRLRYDLLPQAGKLTMPVLMIVGELDDSCPVGHQKILYDALPGPKEMHVIPGAPHTLSDSKHLAELKQLFAAWISKIID